VHSTGGKSNPSKLHLLAGGVAPDAAAAAAPAPSFWILPPRLLLTKLNHSKLLIPIKKMFVSFNKK